MKKYYFLVLLATIGIQIKAQDSLKLDNVEVLKAFQTKLSDINMIQFIQEIPKEKKVTAKYDYNISNIDVKLEYPEPSIRPIAIKREDPIEYHNGFLNLGVGYPLSIYGKAGYNVHYNEKYDFNIGANYFSLNNDKNDSNQKFNVFGIKLDGKYHLNEINTIAGATGFKKTDIYYYSSKKLVDSISRDKRTFFQTNIDFSFGNSLLKNNGFKYSINSSLSIMNLKNEAISEVHLPITLDLSYSFNDKMSISMNTDVTLNFLNREKSSEIHTANFSPALHYNTSKFGLEGGINLIVNNQNQKVFFPRLLMKYELLKEFMVLNIGIVAESLDNNLHYLIQFNPYSNLTNYKIDANIRKEYYVGIDGQYELFSYHLKAGYQSEDNKVLFLIDSTSNNEQFNPVKDIVNSSFVQLNVKYEIDNGIIIGSKNKLRFYEPKQYEYAFGLIPFENEVYINYAPKTKKWNIKAAFLIESGLNYAFENENRLKTNAFTSISLSSNYYFSKNLGAFINIDNMVNSKYERWYGYQQSPFNILGGVKLKF